MPFDPAPRVKTRFQEFADAMLRGCAVSKPNRFCLWGESEAADGAKYACAIGAYYLGIGLPYGHKPGALAGEANAVSTIYYRRYGSTPAEDNDLCPFTREEIAARIATL